MKEISALPFAITSCPHTTNRNINFAVHFTAGNFDEFPKKRAANITRNLIPNEGSAVGGVVALSSARTTISGSQVSVPSDVETVNPKWNQYMSIDKAKNAIKVVGDPVTKVMETLKDVDPYSEAQVKGSVVKIRMDVFDELDEIVFSYLKDAYYEGFKESPRWTKLFHYLCISERKVVEEDFAIFRGKRETRTSPDAYVLRILTFEVVLKRTIYRTASFHTARCCTVLHVTILH